MLGDPARFRLGIGVLGVWAADEDVALRVHPASLAAEGPQGLAAFSLCVVAAAEAAGVMPSITAWEGAALVLPAMGTEERRELPASGQLVEMAGAQAMGTVPVGTAVEGAALEEHVFDPTTSRTSDESGVHNPAKQFGMIGP